MGGQRAGSLAMEPLPGSGASWAGRIGTRGVIVQASQGQQMKGSEQRNVVAES